jgi:hypothetical protein
MSDMTGPDHHAEMEVHYAAGMERQEAAYVQKWLADQMCRVDEPLIESFSNSLSRAGLDRLGAMMAAASDTHFSGGGLSGIRGSRADIDLVQSWHSGLVRAEILAERCRSWQAVAERLETEMQDLLRACDCEIRDQTNNRTVSDKQSAAYAEGALRVANGIAARIREKSAARG